MSGAAEHDDRDVLDRLCEEYARRRRAGEDLAIEAFADEHPGEREQILELFPAMLAMEDLGGRLALDRGPPGGPAPLDPRAVRPLDPSDEYLQARLRSLTLVLASMIGACWLLFRVADVLARRFAADADWNTALERLYLDRAHTWVHASLCLLLAAVWLRLRRRPVSARRLPAIDALLLYACVGCGLVVWRLLDWEDLPFVFALVILVVMTRAVLVPSSGWRTLAVSLPVVPAVLLVILSRGVRVTIHGEPIERSWFLVEVSIYGIVLLLTVGVATAASAITFLLRKQISEAGRLGPYRLGKLIGRGGMGEVYRATHVFLKRPTAVKLMLPGRVTFKDIRRFEREVQQTSRLTHPNTISIHDYGFTAGGVFYYAMELLDGGNLEEVIRNGGPMPAPRAIHVLTQACGALQEAHSLGLIHRDIKPGNIHLCRRGGEHDVVKVLDFGLVKDFRGGGEQLTREGVFVGTPAWGAPEMLADDPIGPPTDLYSLGNVAYYLLTGRPVFEGENPVQVMHLHHSEPPTPPSRHNPEVPPDLETVVLKCLEKEPGERPASAAALREDLLGCADAGRWSPEDARRAWESES